MNVYHFWSITLWTLLLGLGILFFGLIYLSLARKPTWRGGFIQIGIYVFYLPFGIWIISYAVYDLVKEHYEHSYESPLMQISTPLTEQVLAANGFSYKVIDAGIRYYVKDEQLRPAGYMIGSRKIVASIDEKGQSHLFLLKMRFYDQTYDEEFRLYPYCAQEILNDLPPSLPDELIINVPSTLRK